MPHYYSVNKGYIDALFVVLIWSGFVLISRVGGKSVLLSYDVVALRFGTAAFFLMPFWVLRNKVNVLRPEIITLALIGGIGYCLLVYFGFRHAPVAHAGILLPGLLPFEATVFSWLLLGERPSKKRLVALGGIALGVASIGVESLSLGFVTWPGDVAFIAAGSCWAFYATLVRKWRISPWDATIGCALVCAFIYLPIYWLWLPKQIMMASWDTIVIQAFYQGVMAMIVAMIFYMRAMQALGPTKIGLFMALVPVISSIAAAPLLGESLSYFIIIGLTLTSIGAWLGSRG